MSILQNAIDSIDLGIEDYNSEDPRRLVSCTRNIFAGILLLFKHKLATLSPPGSDEVLIKKMILPKVDKTGLLWQGKGSKTVDVQQIRERLDSLGVAVDWSRVEKINKYRNDVEHYFSSLSHNAVQALIADSFIVIRDFVRLHLGEDPLTLLGSPTWATLTSVTEVYEREKHECIEHIEAVDWKYDCISYALVDYRCKECGSGLIDVTATDADRETADFTCRSCGNRLSFEEITPLAISEYYARENHYSIKDSGEPATIICPSCGEDTYILEDDICVLCEESVERECQRCGIDIPPEELDGDGYCGYCAHMMSKDD